MGKGRKLSEKTLRKREANRIRTREEQLEGATLRQYARGDGLQGYVWCNSLGVAIGFMPTREEIKNKFGADIVIPNEYV